MKSRRVARDFDDMMYLDSELRDYEVETLARSGDGEQNC